MSKSYFIMTDGTKKPLKPKTKKARERERRLRAKCKKNLEELLAGGVEVNVQPPGPIVSRAMGVHTSQIAEANEQHRRAGTGCHHLPDGRLYAPDKPSRKRAMKMRKAFVGGKVREMTDLSGFS